MNKIIGYIISIILIGLGVGGLYYLSHPKEYTDTNLVDISPETKYDWATLEKGMYVKLEANNQITYYSYKKDDNGKNVYEIEYGKFITDNESRSNFISNFILLNQVLKGKNLIISSGLNDFFNLFICFILSIFKSKFFSMQS